MEDPAAAQHSVPKQIVYENTYITGPEGYWQVLCLLVASLYIVSRP